MMYLRLTTLYKKIMELYDIPQKYQIFNGKALKVIACVTMTIDHIAACLLYQTLYLQGLFFNYGIDPDNLYKVYRILHTIGRMSFPIFAFLLVEGFLYTKSRMKYAVRLLVLGVISEIPFDICLFNNLIYPLHNNVCFTLFFGLLAIWSWEKFKNRWYIQLPICALMFVAARQLHTDYSWRGVLLIFLFYLMHTWRLPQVVVGLASMYWELPGVILGFVPLLFYNGKRGRQLKYLFYLFYPGHMLLLYLISKYLVMKCP